MTHASHRKPHGSGAGRFVGYIGAWYIGLVEGNFALVMLLATFVRRLLAGAERSLFCPSANHPAQKLMPTPSGAGELQRQGITQVDGDVKQAAPACSCSPGEAGLDGRAEPASAPCSCCARFVRAFPILQVPDSHLGWWGDLILVNNSPTARAVRHQQKITAGNRCSVATWMVFVTRPSPVTGLHQAGGVAR